MSAHWSRAERRALAEFARLNMSTWFDLWHTHPDWKGRGNRCRADVAALTFKLLKHAEGLTQQRGAAVQCWATLCEDTSNNAIYLHSENPNGNPYPYRFDGVQWGVAPPYDLVDIIDIGIHEIGRADYGDEVVYLIRRRI